MQFGSELVLFSSLATILLSAIMATYLLRLWFRQENRLMTDLPPIFAISMMSNAINMVMIALPIVWMFTPSMEYFRLRSIVIGLSIVPMTGLLFQIWLPSIKRYHNRLVLLFMAYWSSIALLGATQDFIMIMTIPLIMGIGVGISATFIVTWKTGRLKEIRSEIMIISTIISMVGQLFRMQFVSTGLFYVPDVLLMVSFILIGLGIANPWNKGEKEAKVESQQDMEIAMHV